MKHPLTPLVTAALFAAHLAVVSPASAADTPELARTRAELLETYKRGLTDSSDSVRQLRDKIAALEYVAANTPAAAPENHLVSIDFPGGPASELIKAAARANSSGFNIIGEKADLAVELPPFSIRNAEPADVATALNGILQPRGYILSTNNTRMLGKSPVLTLRKLLASEVDQRLMGQFQSFQLGPYLEHQTVDDIVGAIRAAWELDPTNKPDALRLKFHPPTGILLVSGPPQGISAVQSLLRELRYSPERDPKHFMPKAAPARSPNR